MASIYRRANGTAEIRFAYNQAFIDQVKTIIPPGYRSWSPEARCWIVIPPYVERVESLLRQRFGTIESFDEDVSSGTSSPNPIRRTEPDFAILHLLPSAPPSLVEAAFRCLSKEIHPDRGGKHETMVEINAAIARLRERQGVAS